MAVYTTIDDPEAYFQVHLYTGTGSTNARTLDGDTDLQPDMSWIKSRNSTSSHCINDSARGVSSGNTIHSNNNGAEDTSNTDAVDSFDSDGVTLGADTGNLGVNYSSSQNYVGWFWKESATSGFDMVLYTGNDTARTISHSLSAKPGLMMVKRRGTAANWQVWHKSLPDTGDKVLYLNTTHAQQDEIMFNDTEPTSSVFSLGTAGESNKVGITFINFLWAEKQGYSKFGSYTGNGNADGTFVYTGFKPAMVIVKRTDSTGGWYIYDNKRAGYNGSSGYLQADTTSAEDTNAGNFGFDLLSNGFKLRGTYATVNNSGGTYVYMAWAEAPFVNSNGVPCNAR